MKDCADCKEFEFAIKREREAYWFYEDMCERADKLVHDHLKMMGRETCNKFTCDLSHWLDDLASELERLRNLEGET